MSLLLSVHTFQVAAQGQGNSPYSVFGLGQTNEPTVTAQDAMGGTGLTFANGFYVNSLNPALLVKNRSIGNYKYVALNVGMKGTSNNIQTVQAQQKDFGMNLSNLSMAFPIRPNWAMSVDLRPYSAVSHKNSITSPISGNISEVANYVLANTGGISKIAWANSLRIKKSLYLGLEAAQYFGSISRDTTITLSSNVTNLLRNSNRSSLSGMGLKAGITWQQKLTEKWQLNVGGVYEHTAQLKGENLRTFSNLYDSGNGPILARKPDTLSIRNVTTTLPSNYRVGISLESPFKWIFAAEYTLKKWSDYRDFDGKASPYLQDSKTLAFGIEHVPNSSSTKYFSQVFYRAGYRQEETPYVINGTRINDRSVSFGLSLPMGFRNPSYLDLSISAGKRGTTANSLIQEDYIKIGASFSLLSTWFIKPKID